jgi:hypothetical protein
VKTQNKVVRGRSMGSHHFVLTGILRTIAYSARKLINFESPSTLFVLSRIDQLQNGRLHITLIGCYFTAEKGVEYDWNHIDCDLDIGTCRSATDLAA